MGLQDIEFIFRLKCPQCGHMNANIKYAPAIGIDRFRCLKCGKNNLIIMHILTIPEDSKVENMMLTPPENRIEVKV